VHLRQSVTITKRCGLGKSALCHDLVEDSVDLAGVAVAGSDTNLEQATNMALARVSVWA